MKRSIGRGVLLNPPSHNSWFGGKRKVADIVWKYFGDVPNYVEPFAGSLSVLLERKTKPKIETVNDIDCYIANFWRAAKNKPKTLAKYAKNPLNEADLHAIHHYLIKHKPEFMEKMHNEPDYFDPKIAGWWVWGISNWIGDGWTSEARLISKKRPALSGNVGIQREIAVSVKYNREYLLRYFEKLADRLENVRVLCGDWKRAVTFLPTINNGITGVMLDPPYAVDRLLRYVEDDFNVSKEVREWAIANGENKMFRIALCGHEGEHNMPDNWIKIKWKGVGYGAKTQTQAKMNVVKERIWFSPHCKNKKGFFSSIN